MTGMIPLSRGSRAAPVQHMIYGSVQLRIAARVPPRLAGKTRKDEAPMVGGVQGELCTASAECSDVHPEGSKVVRTKGLVSGLDITANHCV